MMVLLPVTFVRTHFLDPGQRVRLHQRVRDADDVHPVHDALWKKRGAQGAGLVQVHAAEGHTAPERAETTSTPFS